MALKFITAEEAASYVHHNDNVGFSGFTPAQMIAFFNSSMSLKVSSGISPGSSSIALILTDGWVAI